MSQYLDSTRHSNKPTRKKKKRKREENPVEKWARIKDINRQFSETHMPHNYVTLCFNSLVIIEMQIKTTMRYHFPPISLAKMRKADNAKCSQGFVKLERFRRPAGHLEQHRDCEDQSANMHINMSHYCMFSVCLDIRSVSVKMFLAALFMAARRGRLPRGSPPGHCADAAEQSPVWNAGHKLGRHPATCIHFKITVQTGEKKSDKQ